MKRDCLTILTVLTFMPLLALAQPPIPPTPPAPPPPPPGPGAPGDRHDHGGPKVPITWLGVDTSPIPGVLCDQMNLAKGFGLVVDYVVPDSPAAAAGVQQNDILKMLNDQILMEPNQLSKLVRSYSEGTAVTLTVLRKGKEEKVTVKLGKKEVPQKRAMDFGDLGERMREMQEHLGDPEHGMIHDAVMTAQAEAERVRGDAERRREDAQRVREQAQRVREEAQRAGERAREQAQRVAEQMRQQVQRFAGNGNIQVTRRSDNGLQTTRIDIGKAQIVFSDDKGELRVENIDGKKVLTAKDMQGRLLFSGPVETKDELDKVPADVRQRYENLQQKDLPSVISSQHEEDDSDADTDQDGDDDGDNDDDGGSALEQASFCPQTFPHNIGVYQMVLI
jgi:hypothetical protein